MNTNFAEWLQNEFDSRDLSINRAARMMGQSPGSVHHWLSGRYTPGPKNCRRLARILTLDPDTVLAAAGHRPPPEPIEEGTPEATLVATLRQIDWLRDEAVYRLVQNMLDGILATQQGQNERRVIAPKLTDNGQRPAGIPVGDPHPISNRINRNVKGDK